MIEKILENKGEDQSKQVEPFEIHEHNPKKFLRLAQIQRKAKIFEKGSKIVEKSMSALVAIEGLADQGIVSAELAQSSRH